MTPLNPSSSFRLRHSESALQLAVSSDVKWLRDGLDYALAQVAHEGASADELRGINRFIAIFLNQATEPKQPQPLPDRSRLASYEPDDLK